MALPIVAFITFTLLASGALVCLTPGMSRAQSAAAGLLEQANQAYEEGRFEEAVRLYEDILASGVIHGTVLYNLGNAYFKTDRLGEAILAYERARRLLPRDEDVAANLELARELTVDKIVQEESPLLIRWITSPARNLNVNELTWISFLLYLLTATLVVIGILSRPEGLRKKILVSALVIGVLFILAGGSLAGKITWRRTVTQAVILAPAVDARSGPGEDYTKIFTAHEGTTVRIRQQREGWYLIALPNGLGGWIPDHATELVSRRQPFTKGGEDAEVSFRDGLHPDPLGRSGLCELQERAGRDETAGRRIGRTGGTGLAGRQGSGRHRDHPGHDHVRVLSRGRPQSRGQFQEAGQRGLL
jgi:hypothetical protein